MDCDKSKQANCTETKRFFLGDSDSEDEFDWDEAKERRFSVSEGSECSLNDIVGGVPTNLCFDDDSGLGMSIDGSDERESIGSNDSAQIVPLRPISIGKSPNKHEFNQHKTRRSRKCHFKDFYDMQNDHLGSGAYASVQTCVSRSTGQEFAVKLVNKHEQGHTRSRILREVDVFKMCRGHPNIVQLIEWFEDEDYFYMVFEKMKGGQLLNQIQNKVCFSEQEAAQVTKEIANALKFLHSKGVAHRDLKPENILCVSPDSVAPVKLCDLDLASKPSGPKVRRASRQHLLHNVQSEPDLTSPVGSAEFLAPEVVENFIGEALKYNRMCDMWSLGVLTYILLSGGVPFYGECSSAECQWNQGQFCDDCQEDLFEKIRQGEYEFPEEEWGNISNNAKDLISHLLVKDARKRYTANDVLKHPWISCAPETPLHTANNLFRNNSTKDIQQYNDHFNLNHFTNRLSSKVEEVIPSSGSQSLGSTPGDSSLEINISKNTNDLVVEEASKMLEKQKLTDDHVMFQGQQQPAFLPPQNDLSAMNQMPVYYPSQAPPPLINMNGVMIYPPQMAANMPQFHNNNNQYPQQAYYNYDMNCQQMPPQNHQQVYDPKFDVSTEEQRMKSHKNVLEHLGRVNSNAGLQRSITPVGNLNQQLDNVELKKLQQHRGSLQLGLETCQAMVRQGSNGKDLHQSRETQVNV